MFIKFKEFLNYKTYRKSDVPGLALTTPHSVDLPQLQHTTIIRQTNVKKLQFIHTVNGDGSKTAKKLQKAILTTLASPKCLC